ncbi:hypothetical protein [Vibrio anguillarum]|uniref:Uncharacterized protein n=2 Tax=Vibrio anguillarum TaxID=55601 RepID=A0ABR9Z7H7_VIBAN|nr:hypothetical protein [Vibrio anguillarum]MBF4374405.1 hypothetical protein [Vibrio anguillarum]
MNVEKNKISKSINSNIEREEVKNHVAHGDYFRFIPSSETQLSKFFDEGHIYITVSTNYHHITKSLHNLSLFIPQHERSGERTVSLSYEEFEPHFKYVSTSQAELERKQILSEFELQAMAIQNDIQLSLSKPEAIYDLMMNSTHEAVKEQIDKIDRSIPILPSPSHMASSVTSIVPLVNGQSVDVLKRQLMNQQQLGNVVSTYAEVKSKELNLVLSNTSSVLKEKSLAVMGQAKQMQSSVEDVMDKVNILNRYIGEGVEVHTIIDKPESTSQSKVHFFSHKLYLDEEMLTHHLFTDNHFDHNDLSQFFERLGDDEGFLARILPVERCVVCFQARRRIKHYVECNFTNGELNRANFSVGLLVRDGERVSCIFSDVDYQARLFPTQKEMDELMSRVESSQDVRLTSAQRQVKSLNQTYTELAAILQGIKDRQDEGGAVVFGEMPIEKIGASFFDPECVRHNIEFVNDEDFLIGQHSILSNVDEWRSQHQHGNHKYGDFIVFDSSELTSRNASGLFASASTITMSSYDEEPAVLYRVIDDLQIAQITTYKDTLSVKVLSSFIGYSAQIKKDKNVWVNMVSPSTKSMFNLMNVRLSELLIIMQSRTARPFISDCMTELKMIKDFFEKIDTESKELQRLMNKYGLNLPHDDQLLLIFEWLKNNPKKREMLETAPRSVLNKIITMTNELVMLNNEIIRDIECACDALGLDAIFIASDKRSLIVVSGEHTVGRFPYHTASIDKTMLDVTTPEFCHVHQWINGQLVDKGQLLDHMNHYQVEHVLKQRVKMRLSQETLAKWHSTKKSLTSDIDIDFDDVYPLIADTYTQRVKAFYENRSFSSGYKKLPELEALILDHELTTFMNMFVSAFESGDDDAIWNGIISIMEEVSDKEEYRAYHTGYSKRKDVETAYRIWVSNLNQSADGFRNRLEWQGIGFDHIAAISLLYRQLSTMGKFQYRADALELIQTHTFCHEDYAMRILDKANLRALIIVRGSLDSVPQRYTNSNFFSWMTVEDKAEWFNQQGLPVEYGAYA